MLAVCAAAVLSAAEAWFVTFPVAWTIALLVVRYQETLQAFLAHPLVSRFLIALLLIFRASVWWKYPNPRHEVLDKISSAVFAVVGLIFLASFAVEAVKMWRGRKQRLRA